MAREKYKTVHRERGENHLDFSVDKARLCMGRGSSLSVDLETHEEEERSGGGNGGGGERFSVK